MAALEWPLRYGAPADNLAVVDRLLATAGPVDLALLPESALTSYLSPAGDFDLSPFAEPLLGPTCRALAALARRHRTSVAGPVVERAGEDCFNAVVLHDGAGRLAGHYRKRHPWYPEAWARPGAEPFALIPWGDYRLLIAVCFDLHFLDHEAGALLDSADLLLFPSAWVDDPSAQDARSDLLPALARRHGLWIVNANWGRGRPRVPGQGGSMIVAPDGRIVARSDPQAAAQVVTATLGPPRMRVAGQPG